MSDHYKIEKYLFKLDNTNNIEKQKVYQEKINHYILKQSTSSEPTEVDEMLNLAKFCLTYNNKNKSEYKNLKTSTDDLTKFIKNVQNLFIGLDDQDKIYIREICLLKCNERNLFLAFLRFSEFLTDDAMKYILTIKSDIKGVGYPTNTCTYLSQRPDFFSVSKYYRSNDTSAKDKILKTIGYYIVKKVQKKNGDYANDRFDELYDIKQQSKCFSHFQKLFENYSKFNFEKIRKFFEKIETTLLKTDVNPLFGTLSYDYLVMNIKEKETTTLIFKELFSLFPNYHYQDEYQIYKLESKPGYISGYYYTFYNDYCRYGDIDQGRNITHINLEHKDEINKSIFSTSFYNTLLHQIISQI